MVTKLYQVWIQQPTHRWCRETGSKMALLLRYFLWLFRFIIAQLLLLFLITLSVYYSSDSSLKITKENGVQQHRVNEHKSILSQVGLASCWHSACGVNICLFIEIYFFEIFSSCFESIDNKLFTPLGCS